MNNKVSGERMHSPDVIKGICILLVIITHYAWSETEQKNLVFPFFIDMAVPVFMIVSGFLYAKAFQKHGILCIGDAYLLKNLLYKMIRFTVPFAMAFFIEEIAIYVSGIEKVNLTQMFFFFLKGGIGPGSYYYPVMIQFIFIFPMIYFIIKKYDFKGLMICGFANLIYEVLKTAYQMNEECYRLLLFRYILVIAFGCYLAIGRYHISALKYAVSAIAGIAFILSNRGGVVRRLS